MGFCQLKGTGEAANSDASFALPVERIEVLCEASSDDNARIHARNQPRHRASKRSPMRRGLKCFKEWNFAQDVICFKAIPDEEGTEITRLVILRVNVFELQSDPR